MTTPTTTPDTNGTNTAQSYNWESLVTALLATAGSVLAIVWPGNPVPTSVQTIAVGVAGVLVAAHVHVPKIVTHLFTKVFGSSSSPTGLTSAQTQLLEAAAKVAKEQGV